MSNFVNYKKRPYSKLHHVETHPNDDGTITVEAHLMHHPPMPKGKDGKEPIGMAHPMDHDYPNKKYTMTAEDHDEAGEHVAAIHEAHQHEKGRRVKASDEKEAMEDPHEDEEYAAEGY